MAPILRQQGRVLEKQGRLRLPMSGKTRPTILLPIGVCFLTTDRPIPVESDFHLTWREEFDQWRFRKTT
jgi:hypothetical protein